MAKITALDIGRKRTGIAETDPLQIIASGLTTVRTHDLVDFLKNHFALDKPEVLVVGQPRQMNHDFSEVEPFILEVIKRIEKAFPDLKIVRVDERFTSKMAQSAIREAGARKKQRQDKALVDTVSATLILQSYMEGKR